MKNFDVSLYGHLSYDRIFNQFKEVNSVGCMGNVWNRLISLDPSLKINISPTALGEALIYVDDNQCKRASIANLNLKTLTEPKSLPSSRWNHILYLNELDNDLSWMNRIPEEEIISADVCKGKPIKLDLLKKLDYLFISDEDLFHSIEELTSHTKGWVIMHHKSGSHCSNGVENFDVRIEPLNDINVLGAGDIFAASVIYLKIKNEKMSFIDIITKAHEDTKKCLEKR